MLASDDEEALIGLENHWKKRLDGVLDAFRSEPYFLEVVPQFIDKGNTLGVLMTKLSVSPEEVIAIGDGVCDVTMLQLAGVGIAMGNAEDSVKACVDKQTLTNEEEGVAVAVERTILAEIRPTEVPLDQLNMRARHALMGNLSIQYTYASEDRVEATMPVDTHVFRVSNRTGLAKGKTPEEIEEKLLRYLPKAYLKDAHHWILLHGRFLFNSSKPDCAHCPILDLCEFKDKTATKVKTED